MEFGIGKKHVAISINVDFGGVLAKSVELGHFSGPFGLDLVDFGYTLNPQRVKRCFAEGSTVAKKRGLEVSWKARHGINLKGSVAEKHV